MQNTNPKHSDTDQVPPLVIYHKKSYFFRGTGSVTWSEVPENITEYLLKCDNHAMQYQPGTKIFQRYYDPDVKIDGRTFDYTSLSDRYGDIIHRHITISLGRKFLVCLSRSGKRPDKEFSDPSGEDAWMIKEEEEFQKWMGTKVSRLANQVESLVLESIIDTAIDQAVSE